MLAGVQQWGPGEDLAARRLLQGLVLARRAAATFPADMHDQAKLHDCLQALQGCSGAAAVNTKNTEGSL